jgi:tellurite resistance protein
MKKPSARCQKFRPLVEAAIVIANSDNTVDDTEMEEIVAHLDQHDAILESEHRRLCHYASWLLETQQIDQGFNRLRKTELPKKHRQAIAALGIAIVLRDGTVTDSEIKALRRLYRALELPDDELEALLKPASEAKSGITIDWNAVARLQAETHEVQGMLAKVLAQEDAPNTAEGRQIELPAKAESGNSGKVAAPSPAIVEKFPGLDLRASKVLLGLNGRSEISIADFRALCSTSGLMPSAAIDLINEWADAHLGDRYIDGEGPYQIASQLLAAEG